MPSFKWANEARLRDFQDPANPQCGKIAVFYHNANGCDLKPIDWVSFLREASQIIETSGDVGPDVQIDRKIPGTTGLFYRNDLDATARRYAAREGMTELGNERNIPRGQLYNIAGETDLLEIIGWPHRFPDRPSHQITR
ncbi:MAG: hypothetical protein ACK502_07230 [Alphaproteobacteria bacterium]